MRSQLIGVTERADPTINFGWIPWVEEGRPAILITKDPGLLSQKLKRSYNIIIHCTITGLGGTLIEPEIPCAKESLYYYHLLCGTFGADRVILRIDPIIPNLEPLGALKLLASGAKGRTRISFMDLYPHVRKRFESADITLPYTTFHAPIKERYNIWNKLGRPEVCAEPGLPSTSCVSVKDCEILGVKPSINRKGQRGLCGCLANKKELCTSLPRCTYGCLYCYWKYEGDW